MTDKVIPTEFILPSGAEARIVGKMSGVDQDDLTGQSSVRAGLAVGNVLSRRIDIDGQRLSPGQWEKQLEGDRKAAMIMLRIHSLGWTFPFELTCTSEYCREKSSHTYELLEEDIAFKPYPHGRDTRVRLVVEGKTFFVDLLTGEVVRRQMREKNRTVNTTLRIRKIVCADGDAADEHACKPYNYRIADASLNDALTLAIMEAEPLPTPSATVFCPCCGMPHDIDPTATIGFFSPALATGKRSCSSSATEEAG